MNFYFLIFSVFLLACESWYNPYPQYPPPGHYPLPGSGPHGHPFNPGNPNDTNSQNAPSAFGVVKCHETQYDRFNEELKKFLSAHQTHTRNLHVDCRGKTDTKGGLFLTGIVSFKDDRLFDPSSLSQQLEVDDVGSSLELHIVDINNSPTIIGVRAIPYGSVIRGNTMSLAFGDEKGKVLLDGAVENGIFNGTLSYENNAAAGGGMGHSGQIGIFSIHACKFLKCHSMSSHFE